MKGNAEKCHIARVTHMLIGHTRVHQWSNARQTRPPIGHIQLYQNNMQNKC